MIPLVFAYMALLYLLDDKHFGAALLSAGPHTPAWALAGGALVLLRVALLVAGPGTLCAAVTWGTFRHCGFSRDRASLYVGDRTLNQR